MRSDLVIVESPAKAKTIERYLGPGYKVLASYGHVRDLPENPGKGQLGVDVEHDFAPTYEISPDRHRQLAAIEKAARGADTVYLATDLDREGEAIAWHVAEAINLAPERTARVTFSEITEPAIREAFANPRAIDQDLVDAQQARRIVDRVVGYTLSPLISRKIRRGLSAGRVQSVAVRLVVDRERDIRAFDAVEYWTVAVVLIAPDGTLFDADLVRIDGDKPTLSDAETADRHVAALQASRPIVDAITVKRSKRSPAPPFTTSTLQQEASRKLGFSPKRTMSVAQRLYEGVETPDGQVGLITYMRTDSVALAGQAMGEARETIADRFGPDYTMPKGRPFKTKSKNAQEAHEAIRPTSFRRDPEALERVLERDQARLYRLIWQRALASQMKEKELETTAVELLAGAYGLRSSATKTVFDGFSRVYTEGQDDASEEAERALPVLARGDVTAVSEVLPTQHFTEPPPRYTEASLIKALEDNGIGRPSTYAATISTIVERGYVKVLERRLHPDPVGEVVTDFLVDHFGEFVDLSFTARMEEDLDKVAQGDLPWVPVVRSIYNSVIDPPDPPAPPPQPTDEVCSEGHPMVIRFGRNGRFLACSLYPEHKETRPLPGEEPDVPDLPGVGETCPKCGETDGGVLAAKRGRFGPFVGCSRYPDCDYIKKDGPPPPDPLPFEVVCPRCTEGHLTPRRARKSGSLFWGCSRYPKCDFTTSHEPLGATHDLDGGPVGRKGEDAAMCLVCGSTMELGADAIAAGASLAGGPADPEALARPKRAGGRTGGGRGGSRGAPRGGGRAGSRTRTTRAAGSRSRAARNDETESAPGA